MHKLLNILVVAGILVLLVLQANGITIALCIHSGRISLAEAPAVVDYGMDKDSSCVLYYTFKVSDFSSRDIHFESTPLPLSAVLPSPILPVNSIVATDTEDSAISLWPPGRISHTQFMLRI